MRLAAHAGWLVLVALACRSAEPEPAPIASSPAPSETRAEAPGPDCSGAVRVPGCFVPLPPAELLLGAQAGDPRAPGYDPQAAEDEGPPRRARVAAFRLHWAEVTADEYRRCLEAGACQAADVLDASAGGTVGDRARATYPATGVSWHGADRYCAWLGARLPTEAEWERAARGSEGRRFPWGDEVGCPSEPGEEADTRVTRELVRRHCGPVGSAIAAAMGQDALEELIGRLDQEANQAALATTCEELAGAPPAEQLSRLQGLLDGAPTPSGPTSCTARLTGPSELARPTPDGIAALAGNVWEWTADWYGPVDAARPGGPDQGTERVQRGGAWTSDSPWEHRSAARARLSPDARLPDVGFRCAWSAAP